jgi:hypothetical protein
MRLGLVVGYGSQEFDYRDSNLVAVYDYGQTLLTVSGFVSSYRMEFTGVRAGAFLSCRFLRVCELSAEFILIPSLEAESEAYWGLRDYPFWQEADGTGTILGARLAVDIAPRLAVFTAVRDVSLVCDSNGVEGGILNGETYADEPIVREITADYTGLECGVRLLF